MLFSLSDYFLNRELHHSYFPWFFSDVRGRPTILLGNKYYARNECVTLQPATASFYFLIKNLKKSGAPRDLTNTKEYVLNTYGVLRQLDPWDAPKAPL